MSLDRGDARHRRGLFKIAVFGNLVEVTETLIVQGRLDNKRGGFVAVTEESGRDHAVKARCGVIYFLLGFRWVGRVFRYRVLISLRGR